MDKITAINILEDRRLEAINEGYKAFPEALEMAIESLKTVSDSNWIPVEEIMPIDDLDVLVTVGNSVGIFRSVLAEDEHGIPCYQWLDSEGYEHDVSAWMPLPEPYGGKVNGEEKSY